MPLVHTGNIDLEYDEFGQGEAILLIAGLDAQRTRWSDAWCHMLADQGYRVIRYDNRDAGGSSHLTHLPTPDFATLALGAPPAYTLQDMALDAIGLLDALGIERAHLVGRSMGGMMAQWLAANEAARVTTLVSIMSSTGNPALPGAAPEVMAMLTHPVQDLAFRLAFARRLAGSGFPFDEARERRFIEQEKPASPGGFMRQLAALVSAGDLRPQLARISAPTLVIHGSEDPLILPACGQDTAASIPGAQWPDMPGMGHDIPAAAYARLGRAITAHARRHSVA
ncbi:alpha/beta fold hydrolase [Bordetella avium]|uniref:alpha/beta fold hydrolase n=1 Tax=Bordetella avium TaxID=521 RepID=UPI000E0A665D|nr:alpha/beta fold hydrolase [Bordetella avium]RIQ13116.1 alpha/beta fold hydrolase [Bordetella avium]RIQ37681.1 alpha/beta fold hydrolase [Bordetella avium]RIQ42194.1 alpha/beta fold hydrolase [Bordetella avium]RIQ42640.1 alpha/beta fold hydrolase [Bordetella avium]RIQ49103.1 alpha/beta fold hydrolase [Bordetella avium]